MRNRVLVALATAALVVCTSATPAGARSDTWHNNTFHVRGGVFHAYFLIPKWVETNTFFIRIDGPKHVTHCAIHHGTTNDRARKIDGSYVTFWWGEKYLPSATRTIATCDVVGHVSAALVVLHAHLRESRIPLRQR